MLIVYQWVLLLVLLSSVLYFPAFSFRYSSILYAGVIWLNSPLRFSVWRGLHYFWRDIGKVLWKGFDLKFSFNFFIISHTRFEWIYTLQLPECQGSPCLKQMHYLTLVASSAKWLSVCLRTKWLSVRIPFQSLNFIRPVLAYIFLKYSLSSVQ